MYRTTTTTQQFAFFDNNDGNQFTLGVLKETEVDMVQGMFDGSAYHLGSINIGQNSWHHLAWVRESNGDIYCYLDGVKSSLIWNNIGSMSIKDVFCANVSGDYPLRGYMDEFRVVKQAMWTSNFTPPVAPYDGTEVPL